MSHVINVSSIKFKVIRLNKNLKIFQKLLRSSKIVEVVKNPLRSLKPLRSLPCCLCWKGGSFQVGDFSHFHALLHFLFLPVITRQISWPVLVHLVWSSRVLCGSQPERLPTWQAGACSYLCQSSIGPSSSSGGYMPWLQARLETKTQREGMF